MSQARFSFIWQAPADHFKNSVRFALLLGALVALTGCELRMPNLGLWGNDGPKLGPRIVQLGQPVPKGGGRYKVGEPYRLNGVLYEPAETSHYDQVGIASWYGEMFHGRRTANGEIYDMEALTAAHPTLPIPSYARVTNLQNGRSLVVRINDRGPYARGRIIDLSWGVASLLQMHIDGTARVRVQYLGPAPLDGNDSYERKVLAHQPWAGPRVAYARSPGKAIRSYYHQAAADQGVAAEPTSSLTASAPPRGRSETQFAALKQTAAPVAAPIARAAPLMPAKTLAASPNPRSPANAPHVRRTNKPRPVLASASLPAQPPTPAAIHTATEERPAMRGAAFYIEAGLFHKKATAEEIATILAEIAPATVEPVTIGERAIHRIRLGPFAKGEAAQAAIERIRAAGLKSARLEPTQGG